METKSSSTRCEESEFLKEKLILTSLMDDGIITDIEYRLYASGGRFVDRRAAILKIMLLKYKQEPNDVLEMFKRLTSETNENQDDVGIRPTGREVESIIIQSSTVETGKNPLLNNAILQCLFDFASLKDLKKFRLVCRQWNFNTEPLLRKKSRIHFNLCSLVPKQFIAAFQHSLPDLPFTSFRFSSTLQESKYWKVSAFQWFFDNWGKNIKELNLDKIFFSASYPLKISSWISKSINLTKLTISNEQFDDDVNDANNENQEYLFRTQVAIQLERLVRIKYISLANCTIVLPINYMQEGHRLAPAEITLDGVHFRTAEKNGNKTLKDVRLNDFIDFSLAKSISVTNCLETIFDMTAQIFNSQNLRLKSIKIANFEQARGNLESFHTSEDYVEAIQLDIKELRVTNARVDLCVLPRTIKKIRLEDCSEIICNSAIQLPELQFASFQLDEQYFHLVSRFAACQNLVELELSPHSSEDLDLDCDFDMKLIPRSVKRLKITSINLIGRKITLNLDSLLVEIDESWSFLTTAAENISKMNSKVKTLVVFCAPTHSILSQTFQRRTKRIWKDVFGAINTKEIIKLNKKYKKIVIGIHPNFDGKELNGDEYDEKKESDEGKEEIDFTSLVDKKANYYIFQNQRGKALSKEEFKQWTKMNDLKKY